MKIGAVLSRTVVLGLMMLGSTSAHDAVRPSLFLEEVRWYNGPNKLTANQEIFNPDGLTYASDTDPFQTKATVFWHDRSIIVRCNDRGPNHTELTQGAFNRLDKTTTGVLRGAVIYKTYPTNDHHYSSQASDVRVAPDRSGR